jgi:lysozyme
MDLSLRGGLFIACREAMVLTAYQDGEHLSIGMGDNDPRLRPGDTITVPEALIRFRKAIGSRLTLVNRALKVPVLQHEFDALFSGYYQSGTDLLRDVAEAVNAKDRPAIAAAYLKHDTNAKGVRMDGLLKRRAREICLHLTGEYGALDRIPFWPGDPKKTRMEFYEPQPGDF